jgi:S1-C subfamily serine protease
LERSPRSESKRPYATLIATAIICSLLIGGIAGYSLSNLAVSSKINDLQNSASALAKSVASLQAAQKASDQDVAQYIAQNVTQNVTYAIGENASLSELYQQVKDSVVVVRGVTVQYDVFYGSYYSEVQGSGFIYNYSGRFVVVTNYHVVEGAINVTVTFIDGDAYAATVIGLDPYSDLAILSASAPQDEYKPIEIASSSILTVGDPVLAVGSPYGLAGTVTSGIISAIGRTITESTTSGYVIADCIQTTTPINPGNSGGPLLNYQGQVVGITAAIVTDSQGLGLAIPSNTILREIASLITNGSYNNHPWLGASGTDMTYEIAQEMNTNVTYGWLITQVTSGGPADKAGLKAGTNQVKLEGNWVTLGGDIITAINGSRITNMDDLSTFLEEKTLPDQTISITIVRNNESLLLSVKLGTRPALT